MGQKVNPIGMRLACRRNWRSRWYASKNEYGKLLAEDQVIRRYLLAKSICLGTSYIRICRMSNKVEVTIVTSRPG